MLYARHLSKIYFELYIYLVECLLHEADAALVDGLAVGEEALLQRRGHGGEALQQRKQVLVIVLEMSCHEVKLNTTYFYLIIMLVSI